MTYTHTHLHSVRHWNEPNYSAFEIYSAIGNARLESKFWMERREENNSEIHFEYKTL